MMTHRERLAILNVVCVKDMLNSIHLNFDVD